MRGTAEVLVLLLGISGVAAGKGAVRKTVAKQIKKHGSWDKSTGTITYEKQMYKMDDHGKVYPMKGTVNLRAMEEFFPTVKH